MGKLNIPLLILAISSLAACGVKPVKTEPVLQPLPPAKAPSYSVGDRFEWLVNDKPITFLVTDVDAQKVAWQTSHEQSWIDAGPLVYPALKWKAPSWGTGTQVITGIEGELFPIKVGNSIAISLDGSDDSGESWSDVRRCDVLSEQRVTVPAGSFDTYKIFCTSDFADHTFYYAPELSLTVLRVRYGHKKGDTRRYDLVSTHLAKPVE